MDNKNLFLELVMGLQSSAWVLLGKTAEPSSGKMYRNLDEAKRTIDILMVLKEKTAGNLTGPEKDVLKNSINQLQINYMAELKKEENPEETAQQTPDIEENTDPVDTDQGQSGESTQPGGQKDTQA